MEAAGFSETLVAICQTTRFHVSKDSNLYSYYRENLESHTITQLNVSTQEKYIIVKLCARVIVRA
jgi:hypothetical protein